MLGVQQPLLSALEALTSPADFLLEVGTEEIPPADLSSALEQLQSLFTDLLDTFRLTHFGISVRGTPRRMVVHVSQLAAKQEATEKVKRGPPKARALDEAGKPTKALLGFCRGCGANPATVRFEADKKVRQGHCDTCPCDVLLPPVHCLGILTGSLLARRTIPCGLSLQVTPKKVRSSIPTPRYGWRHVPFSAHISGASRLAMICSHYHSCSRAPGKGRNPFFAPLHGRCPLLYRVSSTAT